RLRADPGQLATERSAATPSIGAGEPADHPDVAVLGDRGRGCGPGGPVHRRGVPAVLRTTAGEQLVDGGATLPPGGALLLLPGHPHQRGVRHRTGGLRRLQPGGPAARLPVRHLLPPGLRALLDGHVVAGQPSTPHERRDAGTSGAWGGTRGTRGPLPCAPAVHGGDGRPCGGLRHQGGEVSFGRRAIPLPGECKTPSACSWSSAVPAPPGRQVLRTTSKGEGRAYAQNQRAVRTRGATGTPRGGDLR